MLAFQAKTGRCSLVNIISLGIAGQLAWLVDAT